MAIDEQIGLYSVPDGLRDQLRTELAGIIATINHKIGAIGSGTNDGYVSIAPADFAIKKGDRRRPPQTGNYILISVLREETEVGLNRGVANTTMTISLLCGVRNFYRRREITAGGVSTADPCASPEDAGWSIAALLARALQIAATRHLWDVDNVFNCYLGRTGQVAPRREAPNVFEYLVEITVHTRVYDAAQDA